MASPDETQTTPLRPSRALLDLVTLKSVERNVEGTMSRIFSAYLGRKIEKGEG